MLWCIYAGWIDDCDHSHHNFGTGVVAMRLFVYTMEGNRIPLHIIKCLESNSPL